VLLQYRGTVFDPNIVDIFRQSMTGEDMRAKLLSDRHAALIVDPDPEETTVLELRLIEQGFEVKIARTVAQAKRILSESEINAVVSEIDLDTPDAGIALREQVIKDGKGRDITWVVLTGKTDRQSAQRAFDLGVDDFVMKPVSTDIFAAKLRQLIERRASQSGGGAARGVSGSLTEMSLPDMIQILWHGRKTCALRSPPIARSRRRPRRSCSKACAGSTNPPCERAAMTPPVLETERLILTLSPPEAAARYLAYAVENEPRLGPLEPPRPEGYFTETYWRKRLEQNIDELERDVSCRFGIFLRDRWDGGRTGSVRLIGHANFSQIARGGFQSCMLGYSLDGDAVGKGLMTEALRAAIDFGFGPLGLHRIQANYMPSNERSGRVLRGLGFVIEGYARDYLFLGGAWRDHILTARLNPNARPPG
jgi:RimJ/RimL family protein N-acetyltransferase/CheY-like chemotaxis protein